MNSLSKRCEFEDGSGKFVPSICRIQSVAQEPIVNTRWEKASQGRYDMKREREK